MTVEGFTEKIKQKAEEARKYVKQAVITNRGRPFVYANVLRVAISQFEDDVLGLYAEDVKERKQKLQELFDFVLAQDKDWRGSYETLGHGYKIYLAESIGFMDELIKKFKGLLKE